MYVIVYKIITCIKIKGLKNYGVFPALLKTIFDSPNCRTGVNLCVGKLACETSRLVSVVLQGMDSFRQHPGDHSQCAAAAGEAQLGVEEGV